MKTKYSAICCYFGKWPNYFQQWLDSCKTNTDITFILVTDIPTDSYRVPANVRFERYSFADVQEKIRSKFSDLKVSIEKPYKLCCFKAAYGYIFDDLFNGFDYWGFFDIDTIWGDIVKFIPENADNHLAKIFPCGHLSFIRNDIGNRKPFELIDTIVDKYPNGYLGVKIYPYKHVFTYPECFYYDELGGMEPYYKHREDTYYGVDFSNVDPRKNSFQDMNKVCGRVLYRHTKDGRVLRIHRSRLKLASEEISYVHISKRRLQVSITNEQAYLIRPNEFVIDRSLSLLSFIRLSIDWNPVGLLKFYLRQIKNTLRHYIYNII